MGSLLWATATQDHRSTVRPVLAEAGEEEEGGNSRQLSSTTEQRLPTATGPAGGVAGGRGQHTVAVKRQEQDLTIDGAERLEGLQHSAPRSSIAAREGR